jgi:hypothetical protein
MQAYLTLTLEAARTIVAPGLYHEHWVEAKFAIEEHEARRNALRVVAQMPGLNRFGDATDPNATHFVMTFVRASKGEQSSPALTYGPQIYDTDPLLRPMKIAQLLASVGQPKGAKR